MTNHVARLYAIVVGVVVFFVAWAAIAAHPWQQTASVDPRVAAIAARQQVLQREAIQVKQIVDRRWAAYRVALTQRNASIAQARTAAAAAAQTQAVSAPVPTAAPPVRVVTLPPLVVTRTS